MNTLPGNLRDVGAGSAAETLEELLQSLAGRSSSAGVAFVVGLATELRSASGYVRCFGPAMKRRYVVRESLGADQDAHT